MNWKRLPSKKMWIKSEFVEQSFLGQHRNLSMPLQPLSWHTPQAVQRITDELSTNYQQGSWKRQAQPAMHHQFEAEDVKAEPRDDFEDHFQVEDHFNVKEELQFEAGGNLVVKDEPRDDFEDQLHVEDQLDGEQQLHDEGKLEVAERVDEETHAAPETNQPEREEKLCKKGRPNLTRDGQQGGGNKRKKEEDSDDTDDSEKPRKRTRRSRTTFQKAKPKPEYMWKDGQPIAKLHKTEETDLTKHNLGRYLNCEDFADKCSERLSRVVEPRSQDMLFYADIDKKTFNDMALLDGLCWRNKGINAAALPYKIHQVFAEVDIPTMYGHKFRKYMAYDEETRRMVVLYQGDHRFGCRHPWTSKDVDVSERPPAEHLLVHPNDVKGQTPETMKRYLEIWNATKDERKSEPEIGGGRQAAPPPTQEEKLAGKKEDAFFVDPTPYRTQREQPGRSRTKRGIVTDNDTDDDLGDDTRATASGALPHNFRRAKPGYTVKKDIPMQLTNILALKQLGDRTNDQWETEKRGSFYESVCETLITDPQPNEVYYRDFKVPPGTKMPFALEEKEANDGYSWKRKSSGLLPDQWSIYKVTFVNFDQGSSKLNFEWTKTFYIFPKEDKMIIHYRGSKGNAAK